MSAAHLLTAYLDSLFGLEGRLAVVTGASKGIGLAIAETLTQAGSDIIGVSYDMPSGESNVRTPVKRHNRTFTPFLANWADRVAGAAIAAELTDRDARILVATAAPFAARPPPDTPTRIRLRNGDQHPAELRPVREIGRSI